PLNWLLGLLAPVLVCSAVLAVVAGLLMGDFKWAVLSTVMLADWVLLAGVRALCDRTRHKGLFSGQRRLTRIYWSMQLAVIGIVVF
ncbi:cytochrome c-type biogenesis CcmF C-terminal domain-containing protein, partial [Pseudomonas syringae pv. tagetis]|uniref:cytochrome c-type biogenesis CcmF C-terminal domain-containing protein n=1 Tax=Pseudomonas syringae group genomosp. 7 TaxID=251699 RepID=UPI00376F5826